MVSMSTLLVTRNEDKSVTTSFEEGEFLGEGDLTVDVSYSSLNYKDAMAIAGDRGVMRTSPLVPGIDVVGTVAESSVERLPVGTLVASFGDGLGEFRHGGYTPKAVCEFPGDRRAASRLHRRTGGRRGNRRLHSRPVC